MIAYADVVTGTGVYPPPTTLTGTLTSLAASRTLKVTGDDSSEITRSLIGKWLYANNQCRKIVGTRDGSFIYIEKDFDAAVNTTFRVVDNIGGQVSFVNLSTNEITVNDGTFGSGVGNAFLHQPIWYVLGASEMQIEIQYP